MGQPSLLAYIVRNYCVQAENIATDSLKYILEKSSTTKETFIGYIKQRYGIDIPVDAGLQSQTQYSRKNRPDISIIIPGKVEIFIEAKFGATLTPNQPVGYWNELLDAVDGLLLFIAPEWRLPELWTELTKKFTESKLGLVEHESYLATSATSTKKRLALASWGDILDCLFDALEAVGEKDTASDVSQLRSLCHEKDILDLDVEEKNGPNHQLVDEINKWLKTNCKDFASKKGLRNGQGWDFYAQFIRIYDYDCGIYYHAGWQRLHNGSPLWFAIFGNWVARERLLNKEIYSERDIIYTPLYVEYEAGPVAKLENLRNQILDIAQKLAPEKV